MKEKAKETLREENKEMGEEGLKFSFGRETVILHKALELMDKC